ncbi:hypothetical protein HDU76_002947, partial [Blyttiomyces sp. JEL0837]
MGSRHVGPSLPALRYHKAACLILRSAGGGGLRGEDDDDGDDVGEKVSVGVNMNLVVEKLRKSEGSMDTLMAEKEER